MPNREKVIEYLNSEIYRAEQSVNDIWLECVEVKLLRDALALLKEQPQIVLCKDCKYFDETIYACLCGGKMYGFHTNPEWFCANGERRTK